MIYKSPRDMSNDICPLMGLITAIDKGNPMEDLTGGNPKCISTSCTFCKITSDSKYCCGLIHHAN